MVMSISYQSDFIYLEIGTIIISILKVTQLLSTLSSLQCNL
jgi:hypothetical protein